MAYEFYVTIEGSKQGKFKGDSKRRAHKDQIVGLAFDYEVSAPYDPASGLATGKRQHQPVTITKRWGAATSQLFQAHEHRGDPPAQGAEVVYHTVKLINARVAAIHQYADADVHEAEDVSFVFQKIEITNKTGSTSASDDWG